MARFALALATALLLAPAAWAGTLTSYSLKLVVGAGATPSFPPLAFGASGLVGAGNATGATAWSVATGVIAGSDLISFPTTISPPVSGFRLVINGNPSPGAFAASAGGKMPLPGFLGVRVLGGSFPKIGVILGSPVSVKGIASGIGMTAHGNAWTTKTTTIVGTAMNPGSFTAVGSNGLVGGAGSVALVSGLNLLTSTGGQIPAFATLTLNYAAPEPVTLTLMGVGAAVLLAVGARKRRG